MPPEARITPLPKAAGSTLSKAGLDSGSGNAAGRGSRLRHSGRCYALESGRPAQQHGSDETALAALRQIAEQYTDTFQMWRNYRDAVPYMQQLKELTTQRILHSTAAEPYAELPQLEEIVRLVTERTVDMLMGSMKSEITPELVRQSCAKIKDRGRF